MYIATIYTTISSTSLYIVWHFTSKPNTKILKNSTNANSNISTNISNISNNNISNNISNNFNRILLEFFFC